MPCDYSKYPPDWEERRQRILERAGHCCEFCGVKNHNWIERGEDGKYTYTFQDLGTFVILTIAHLDHDPENWDVSDDRLRALCQRCHLQYDREQRKKEAEKLQLSLF